MSINIQLRNAQGYLWYSDQTEPETYNNKPVELILDEKRNHFIIEGQLDSDEEKKSISIKFIDGNYIVKTYDFNARRFIAPDSAVMTEGQVEQYFANSRLELSQPLNFIRVWKTVEDKINDNWETLRPTGLVFKGFGTKIKGGNHD